MARVELAGRELEWAAFSESGDMPHNEDSVVGPIQSADGRLFLWAIADGLGGQGAGDQASRTAVNACETVFRSDTSGTLSEVCSRVIEVARRALVELRACSPEAAGAASTLSFLVTDGTAVAYGHVGDSRLYRFRDGAWSQLSEDQSVAFALMKAGQGQGDLRNNPDRSRLFSVLGGQRTTPHVGEVGLLRKGDVFILCSDGVWEPVIEEQMLSFLADSPDINRFLSRVKAAAAAAGGHRDNFSAAAITAVNEPVRMKPTECSHPHSATKQPTSFPRAWIGYAASAVLATVTFVAGVWTGRVSVTQNNPHEIVEARSACSPAPMPKSVSVPTKEPEQTEMPAEPERPTPLQPKQPKLTTKAEQPAIPDKSVPVAAPAPRKSPQPPVEQTPAETGKKKKNRSRQEDPEDCYHRQRDRRPISNDRETGALNGSAHVPQSCSSGPATKL